MSQPRVVWGCVTGDIPPESVPTSSDEIMQTIVYAQYAKLIADLPTEINSGWVPTENGRVGWAVILGYATYDQVPDGGDLPMRNAVRLGWRTIELPESYEYISSGWFDRNTEWVTSHAREWFGSSSPFA